jgi:hypothetical protein
VNTAPEIDPAGRQANRFKAMDIDQFLSAPAKTGLFATVRRAALPWYFP